MFEAITYTECSLMESDADHVVDTRSGEATCTVCGATKTIDATDLVALLED